MNDDFFRRRLFDLASQSDRTNTFTFTDFLNEAERAEYYAVQRSLPPCGVTVWGGHEEADRVMLRFGNPETLGYETPFPIVCVQISPAQEKFADDLSHRDILGAVMHLGIERGEIGDILIDGKQAYFFCKETMAPYLCRELSRIRHTTVTCSVTEQLPAAAEPKLSPMQIQVASARIDGVIAKVYHISRSDCLELFRAKRVFLNGVCTENHSGLLSEGDKVSVRGFGKLRFAGISGQTRKGNLIAQIEKFV